jgi:putative endonuclease
VADPPLTDWRRATGASGEDAVAAWYGAAGYHVVDRNWRVREGEIDVVARRGPVLVFCEVKTRRGDRFGTPAEAVTARKRQRLRLLARLWLAAHESRPRDVRFDVAEVLPDGRGGWSVDVLEAAF